MDNFIDNVLKGTNEMAETIARIEGRLFDVRDVPMTAPVEGFEAPKGQHIYTTDGRWLGNTGNEYESIQPRDFLAAIVDGVSESGMELDLAGMTYTERAQGRIIEFRVPTGIIEFKNASGRTDTTKLFLNFETGFGGAAKTSVGLYSHRLICVNGMRIIQSVTEMKVKHTARMNRKAMIFTNEIIKTASKVSETAAEWTAMNSQEVSVAVVERFHREMAGFKKNETLADVSTRKQNIYNGIGEAIEIEFRRTGANVWGLLNSASHYFNHVASGSDDPDYITHKTGAKKLELAQSMARELVLN